MAFTIVKTPKKTDTLSVALKREILVDSEADLSDIPAYAAPGSVAYTADMSSMWMKDNAGDWQKIGG